MTPAWFALRLTLAVATLMVGEKVWKHWTVVRFFRRATANKAATVPLTVNLAPQRISILQPILSGDPTLARCLERNLQIQSRYELEYIWLIDADDAEAKRLCSELIDRFPNRDVKLLQLPPPDPRCSPKTTKLIAGAERATGDVICVLDDDTMLPNGGLEQCLPYLDHPGVGLAFGLPYYVHFGNVWSALVACFVNSHALMTYIPYTALVEPFTINGMFFAVRRATLDDVGGFRGLETALMDDFAIARRFRSHGYRLAQTPLLHPISNHVSGPGHYVRLLQRWFIFPRETVMKALPPRDLAVTYGLGLVATMSPLILAGYLMLRPSWLAGLVALAYTLYHMAIFAHFNHSYLRHATPWRFAGLVPIVQWLLPLQLLVALMSPQRIVWRGHVMQIEKGGTFRFVKRGTDRS